ncbi:MAG: hypothetical protein ACYS8W_14855 [Planctomycetota bacterium]
MKYLIPAGLVIFILALSIGLFYPLLVINNWVNQFEMDMEGFSERAENVGNTITSCANIGAVLNLFAFILIAISVYFLLRETSNMLRARGINPRNDMAGLVLVMVGFLSLIQIQLYRLLPESGSAGFAGMMKLVDWYIIFSSFFEGLFFFLGFLLIYLGIKKAARAVRAPAPKNLKRVLTAAIIVLSCGIIYIGWMFYGIFWIFSTIHTSSMYAFFGKFVLYIFGLMVCWIALIVVPLVAAYLVNTSVQTVPALNRKYSAKKEKSYRKRRKDRRPAGHRSRYSRPRPRPQIG